MSKRFRFGLSLYPCPSSATEVAEQARWAEAAGFSTLLLADHLRPDQLDPMCTLVAAADATTTLHVGTFVLNNDLRHPALVARQAATLQRLSGGRFELGMGAGHMRSEYESVGFDFQRGRIRVERLGESVHILKALLSGQECTFFGRHYRLQGHRLGVPASPPPLLVGGNGPRLLALAAREANAVGFCGFSHRRGGQEITLDDFVAAALDRQVRAVREAAGPRFGELELNALVQQAVLTDRPRSSAEELASRLPGMTAEAVLASPYLLIGSADAIAEQLMARRERFGISYWTLFSGRGGRELGEVAGRLAGT